MADYAEILSYAVNDRRPFVNTHVFETEGNALHVLTGSETIRFYMRELDASTNKIDGVTLGASIKDAVNGVLEYQWQLNDLDTVGHFECWFTIEPAAGEVETVTPTEIVVDEAWNRTT